MSGVREAIQIDHLEFSGVRKAIEICRGVSLGSRWGYSSAIWGLTRVSVRIFERNMGCHLSLCGGLRTRCGVTLGSQCESSSAIWSPTRVSVGVSECNAGSHSGLGASRRAQYGVTFGFQWRSPNAMYDIRPQGCKELRMMRIRICGHENHAHASCLCKLHDNYK